MSIEWNVVVAFVAVFMGLGILMWGTWSLGRDDEIAGKPSAKK